MAKPSAQNPITTSAIPVINRVSSGPQADFSDLRYLPRLADEYLSCPDVTDRQAFAARSVWRQRMTPKYRAGDIVVFSPLFPPAMETTASSASLTGRRHSSGCFSRRKNSRALLRLQPRNRRHRAYTVPSEQVAGLYKAVYRYERVDEE